MGAYSNSSNYLLQKIPKTVRVVGTLRYTRYLFKLLRLCDYFTDVDNFNCGYSVAGSRTAEEGASTSYQG